MNIATLKVYGDDAALADVRDGLPSEPERAWAKGEAGPSGHAHIDAGISRRRHSDNREGAAVQRNRIANDIFVGAEFFPKLVTKNGNRMAVWRGIFLRQKCAPEKWAQFQKVKVISADHLAEDIGGLAPSSHPYDSKAVTGHSAEDAVLLPVIEKIEVRIGIASGKMSIGGEDLQHSIGVSNGKRTKQKRVNDSEDGRVDSDPKGDRDKGDGEKSRAPD